MPINYLDFMRALTPYDLDGDGATTPADGVPAERLARDLGLMENDRLLATDPHALSEALQQRRGRPLGSREASWTGHALEEAGARDIARAFRDFTQEANVQLAMDLLEGFLDTDPPETLVVNGLRYSRAVLEDVLRRSRRGERAPALIQTLAGAAYIFDSAELSPQAVDRLGALAYSAAPTVRLSAEEQAALRDAVVAGADFVGVGEHHLHAGAARVIRDLITGLEGGKAAVGALVLETDESLQGALDEVVSLHRALASAPAPERRSRVTTALRQVLAEADESRVNILGSFAPDLPSRRHDESVDMLWAAMERGVQIHAIDRLDHGDDQSRDAIMAERIEALRDRVNGPIVGLFGALHVTREPVPDRLRGGIPSEEVFRATDIDRQSLVMRARERGLRCLAVLVGPNPILTPDLFDLSLGRFETPEG